MDIGWKLASAGSLAVATLAANTVVKFGWKAATGHTPPSDGEEAATANLAEVVIFAAVSGILVTVFQRLAMRKANHWYGGKKRNALGNKN